MDKMIIFLLFIQINLSLISCYQLLGDDGPICLKGWYWDPRCGDNRNEIMYRSLIVNETSIDCSFKFLNGTSISTLTCNGLNQSINCDAYYVSTLWIELFMISANPLGVLQTIPEEFIFSLYPARADGNGFHESKVLGLGPWNNTYSFYYSPEKKDEGIRIKDPLCAKRIFNLFTSESILKTTIPVFVGEEGQIETFGILGKLEIKTPK